MLKWKWKLLFIGACIKGIFQQRRLQLQSLPPELLEQEAFRKVQQGLIDLFGRKNLHKVFLTGGFVRDLLLGRASNDLDVMVLISERELVKKLKFRKVDPETAAPVFFRIHPELGKIEASLPRIDYKVGAGYNGFVFFYSRFLGVLCDLVRRDFTVNAIALRLDGKIVDPMGGMKALHKRLLIPCREDSFLEDPLRIYRAVRFHADGWELSASLLHLINGKDWTEEMAALPIERKVAEMMKAMGKEAPWRFFDLCRQLCFDREFLPQLYTMHKVAAGPAAFRSDLYTHSRQVLQFVAKQTKDPVARLAAFLHDFGKLVTVLDTEEGIRHLRHDLAGHDLVGKLALELKLSKEQARQLSNACLLHMKAQRWHELRPVSKVRLAEDALKAGIAGFLPLVAQANGTPELTGWSTAVEAAALNCKKLGLDERRFKGCRKCTPKEERCVDDSCPIRDRNRKPLPTEMAKPLITEVKSRWMLQRLREETACQ